MAKNRRRTREKRTKQNRRQAKRIDVLPDDVLLEIFYFYVNLNLYSPDGRKTEIDAWQSLVHVCRRWRSLVLGSPRCLNLRLYCTFKTPAKDKLDVWPALPLIVGGNMASSSSTDNVIAALEQSNRVCQVNLGLTGWQLEKVLAAMQVPFPELTDLRLWSRDETPPVIPDSFMGGSAPSLRSFSLSGIPFSGLSQLVMSATHLVFLWLSNIPHSGYISPQAMVALLSVLSSLERLHIEFESPQSRPDRESRSLRPLKRSILTALYEFHFRGVTEYLEELVTLIDTPQLDEMHITFFNQIDFDCPQLAQYINRTPTLRALDEARVEFDDSTAIVKLRYHTSGLDNLEIGISCREPDWQLSSIEQVCNSSRSLSTVEDLYIEHEYSELVWKNDAIEDTLWLQLLLPFTTVKNLYLSDKFEPGIAGALEELVGGRITEVLPSLENIFVEGLKSLGPFQFQKKIGRFVAARQFSDHPVKISLWNRLSAGSPLSPITPFGVFVDRAVAASQFSSKVADLAITPPFDRNSIQYTPPSAATPPYESINQQSEVFPAPDVVPMAPATLLYQNVADPLAEWIATFIWKVCTTGMCLRAQCSCDSIQQHSPSPPPPYLANSVRSLLLSTLLQPSTILLGIWYIVHLPVRFGHISLKPDAMKEMRFRLELFGLGEWQDSGSLQAAEVHAAFRLVLLGCMLANKWLDDRIISNKTWNIISGVQIQSSNRLESLALDIFSYHLSITPYEWNRWLVRIFEYHKSLSSAPGPHLISRPSSNPHFVMQNILEVLLENASRSCSDTHPFSQPQPVFQGPEERLRKRLDTTILESSFKTLEIDLDEDGPLLEEYLQKRRTIWDGSFCDTCGNTVGAHFGLERGIEQRSFEISRPLPPPAKWNPAADEPLRSDMIKEPTHYVAVQPPPVPPVIITQYPLGPGHSWDCLPAGVGVQDL